MFHPSIGELIHLTLDSVQEINAFKKVARNKVVRFALDILFIALGVRTGYLFDAFAWNDKTSRTSPLIVFESLLQGLKDRIPLFGDVVILKDTFATDFAFVNVPLLIKRMEAGDLPTFVSIEDATPAVLPRAPSHVATHLHALSSDLTKWLSEHKSYPLSLTIPWDGSNPAEAVPLVGILLDYPIAYQPGDGDTGPFLSNVELEVLTYVLSRAGADLASDIMAVNQEHQLLQFSCPRTLLAIVGDIEGQLRLRLERRIADLRLPYELAVRSRTERLDRVAL